MASVNNVSSIAAAFAGMTASVDIPKPRDGGFFMGRDSFAAVAARSLPTNKQPTVLPTPPNSISPSLPPHGFKAHGGKMAVKAPSAPIHVDSDIDLQDAVDHAKCQDQPQHGFGPTGNVGGRAEVDVVGAITPGLLAKHHLPDILLAHGPLAIRHVMGYLTTSVPGFSRIPPAKARRLVVGALEGRSSGGEGGGVNGEVEFEKVGWGRWDAKMKGHPARDNHHSRRQGVPPVGNISPPASVHSSYTGAGMEIPTSGHWQNRNKTLQPGSSTNGDSIVFSYGEEMDYVVHHEDVTMLEHEADKMSLDGDASCSSSEAPDDGPILDEDIGDVTDEEDWANIGAAALRQGSYPTATSGGGRNYNNSHLSTHRYANDRSGGGPASSALAKSMPMPSAYNFQQPHDYVGFSHMDGFGVGSDLQEREAVEALLRLSSV